MQDLHFADNHWPGGSWNGTVRPSCGPDPSGLCSLELRESKTLNSMDFRKLSHLFSNITDTTTWLPSCRLPWMSYTLVEMGGEMIQYIYEQQESKKHVHSKHSKPDTWTQHHSTHHCFQETSVSTSGEKVRRTRIVLRNGRNRPAETSTCPASEARQWVAPRTESNTSRKD